MKEIGKMCDELMDICRTQEKELHIKKIFAISQIIRGLSVEKDALIAQQAAALRALAEMLCEAYADNTNGKGCENCRVNNYDACTMYNHFDDIDRSEECYQIIIDYALKKGERV